MNNLNAFTPNLDEGVKRMITATHTHLFHIQSLEAEFAARPNDYARYIVVGVEGLQETLNQTDLECSSLGMPNVPDAEDYFIQPHWLTSASLNLVQALFDTCLNADVSKIVDAWTTEQMVAYLRYYIERTISVKQTAIELELSLTQAYHCIASLRSAISAGLEFYSAHYAVNGVKSTVLPYVVCAHRNDDVLLKRIDEWKKDEILTDQLNRALIYARHSNYIRILQGEKP